MYFISMHSIFSLNVSYYISQSLQCQLFYSFLVDILIFICYSTSCTCYGKFLAFIYMLTSEAQQSKMQKCFS